MKAVCADVAAGGVGVASVMQPVDADVIVGRVDGVAIAVGVLCKQGAVSGGVITKGLADGAGVAGKAV